MTQADATLNGTYSNKMIRMLRYTTINYHTFSYKLNNYLFIQFNKMLYQKYIVVSSSYISK